jgi:hypothetical protein
MARIVMILKVGLVQMSLQSEKFLFLSFSYGTVSCFTVQSQVDLRVACKKPNDNVAVEREERKDSL